MHIVSRAPFEAATRLFPGQAEYDRLTDFYRRNRE